MSQPGTLAWFAAHELRLAWRDWLAMMTAGKRSRERTLVYALLLVAGAMHLLAYGMIGRFADEVSPEASTFVAVTGAALLSWMLMLSQAMESVTRAFYARDDLDLIISSPATVRRLFAVRIGAIAMATMLMALLIAAPFVNILAIFDSSGWLAAYIVVAALAALAASVAVATTVGMFRVIGPRRTRFVSQITAAIIGAAFIIGIQAAAILSHGTLSRTFLFRSDGFVAAAPGSESPLWWPARAAMGELPYLAALAVACLAILALTITAFSKRFGDHVIRASSAMPMASSGPKKSAFVIASPSATLRRKEWTLLRRDPWLISQTLMQILYLLPPALLLWRNFGAETGGIAMVTPIIVMAAGQLAGGLAWLAISGEDAPDLVATAPVPARAVIRAKVEAVFGATALIVAPLIVALALASPWSAIVTLLGCAAAAGSATTVQFWFRSQANRSMFRRRQVSSRTATFVEAFSSIAWAATAGIAAAGSYAALASAGFACLVIMVAYRIRPIPES